MTSSKRLTIFLICIAVGPLLGFLLTSFWFAGGGTFWEQVAYFPYPVAKILALQPYGNEFWVETTDGDVYHILYPCEGAETCWQIDETVPDVVPSDSYVIGENKCVSDYFIYPLFGHKITACVTSTEFTEAPKGSSINSASNPWRVSLALTNDNQLWIWQKPWNFPNRVLAYKVFFTFLGLLLGSMVDTLLTRNIKPPSSPADTM